jgi:hypothetical protein
MLEVPDSGVPGTLLLWPGHVIHDVLPHEGAEPRISVAFNLFVSILK